MATPMFRKQSTHGPSPFGTVSPTSVFLITIRTLIISIIGGLVVGALWVALTPTPVSAQGEARFEITAVVNNGTSTAGDVTVSLRDAGGSTIVAAPGSVSRVVPGSASYAVGYSELPGYEATTSCLLSDGTAQYPGGGLVNAPAGVTITCTISFTLAQQAPSGPVPVSVTSNVINDDGGTASSGSFVVEVYNAAGSRIASNNGSLSTTVPRGGSYTIGVINVAGYTTAGVSCSVEQLSATFDEALSGFNGSTFSVDGSVSSVSCSVTSDDNAAAQPTATAVPPTAVPATPVPTATSVPTVVAATAVPATPVPTTGSVPESLAFADPTATPVRVAATATPQAAAVRATATPRPTAAAQPTATARPTATVRSTATPVPQRSSGQSGDDDAVPTLAFTGADDALLATLGLLLILFGMGFMAVARRTES